MLPTLARRVAMNAGHSGPGMFTGSSPAMRAAMNAGKQKVCFQLLGQWGAVLLIWAARTDFCLGRVVSDDCGGVGDCYGRGDYWHCAVYG